MMNQMRALLQRMFGLVKHHMGTDQFGNKYYYIPQQKTWTGQTIRSKRMIEAVNPKEIEYEVGDIPSEWEAWIRGRRKDPPTIEEILHNEEYRRVIKIHAHEVQQKEEIRKEKEYKEGLVAQPIQTQAKGHASGKDKLSPEPTSTSNSFQPGGWLPPGNSSKKK